MSAPHHIPSKILLILCTLVFLYLAIGAVVSGKILPRPIAIWPHHEVLREGEPGQFWSYVFIHFALAIVFGLGTLKIFTRTKR
jgi:NADH:ubiquinone oxidoreductase subunit 5 (subunit L)/multisubunit Na+/H+ antiporter MnhA subunit